MNKMLKKKGLWHLSQPFPVQSQELWSCSSSKLPTQSQKRFPSALSSKKSHDFNVAPVKIAGCLSSSTVWSETWRLLQLGRVIFGTCIDDSQIPANGLKRNGGLAVDRFFTFFLSLIIEGSRLRNAMKRGRYRHYILFSFNLQVSFWVQNASDPRWWFFEWLSEKHGARKISKRVCEWQGIQDQQTPDVWRRHES